MTRIDDRLRKALAEEADSTSVDVLRMRDELTDRLDVKPRRRRVLPMAAAAMLLTGGAVVGVQTLGGDDSRPDAASPGEVDSEFSCPETQSVDLSGAQDEFLPDLTRWTPAEVAREYDAPRWELDEDGDTARLRLGNADGTLGSETRYERRDGEWQMRGCGRRAATAPRRHRPPRRSGSAHMSRSHGRPRVSSRSEPRGAASVLVDDRPVYDYSGLTTRHRAIYVAPCGIQLCFAVGRPDGVILPKLRTFSGRDAGILGNMCHFFEPDDLVGRSSPYVVLVAWDATGRTTDLTIAGPGRRL